jgi:hypothetical protein
MIFALFDFVNPLWEFFIAPMILLGIGFWARPRYEQWFEKVFMVEENEEGERHLKVVRLVQPPKPEPELYDWMDDPEYRIE